jgi:hypothetical protein
VGELSFLFIFFVLCLRLVLLWPAFGGVHLGGAELRVVRLPDLTPLPHPPQGSCSPFARNLGRCSCRIYPPASAQAQHIRAQAVFVLLHTPHLHSPLCRAKLAHQEGVIYYAQESQDVETPGQVAAPTVSKHDSAFGSPPQTLAATQAHLRAYAS